MLITGVEFGSAAAAKGLVQNMVILSFNDEPISSVADWDEAIARLRPGAVVKLECQIPRGRALSVYLRVPEE